MLKIQIVSDLHIEFLPNKFKFNFIKPMADILALLGDICCIGSTTDFATFQRFIKELVSKFKIILFISGNHEYYNNSNIKLPMADINAKIKAFCKSMPNVYFLNNATKIIAINKKKYLFVGSTLWSAIPKIQQPIIANQMSDYQYIYATKLRRLIPTDVVRMHNKNVKFITAQIAKAKKGSMRVVILTHHKPYLKSNHNSQTLDCAYETDLQYLIKKPVVLWAYGHTHIADDRYINNVRVFSNPKGYPNQHTGFIKDYVVQI